MKVFELIARLHSLPKDAIVHIDNGELNGMKQLVSLDATSDTCCVLRSYQLKRESTVILDGQEYEITFRKLTEKKG